MALAQLDSLRAALAGNSAISAMVDGKIYKFKPVEKSEQDLKSAPNKSLISCEVGDWNGEKTSLDPVFVVDIRSRKGTDGGAEYCAEIAKAAKELLDSGFGTGAEAVSVSKIRGEVVFEKDLMSYRCRLEVFGHIKPILSLGIAASLASPQPAKSDIIFVAAASPAEGLEYRFLVQGQGTGCQWRDMTGWQSRNSFDWKTSEQDIGSSAIMVQARGGRNKIAEDAEAAISFTITAASGGSGSGSLPTISSLTPSLSSPRGAGTKLEFICVASDVDNDPLVYRFFITGPGTGGKKKLVQDWSARNSLSWTPGKEDIGSSTIEAQVRDGEHSGPGSYDASISTVFAVSSNSLPTITGLYPNLAGPQADDKEIDFICIAVDPENDPIDYRFYLTGPGTAGKKKLVQDWSKRNSWRWSPAVEDIGANTVTVEIRDGEHAGAGSNDAATSIVYTITAASGGSSGSGSLPTIISFMPSFPSPQPPGLEIDLICTASDAEGNELFYKFLHQPPATAYWKDLTSWQSRNWTTWKPTLADSGVNSLKVQVIDGKHAEKGGCDATTTISYTIAP